MAMQVIPKKYQSIAVELNGIMEKAKKDLVKAGKDIMITAYWTMGKRIAEHNIPQGNLSMIADIMEVEYTLLNRCVIFYQQYPKAIPADEDLSWSHHRELLSVKPANQRKWYKRQVKEKKLSIRQLSTLIKFSAYTESKGGKAKDTSPIVRPKETTYLYRAELLNIIDGDTIIVRIDLGFDTWRTQRIRLAEIDCPERKTPEGEAATQFVKQTLEGLEWVMIRTNRIDVYGRYVGYIFYDRTQTDKYKIYTKGRFLNQEIINAGHAVKV